MIEKNLRRLLLEFYGAKSMRPETMERLLNVTESGLSESAAGSRRPRRILLAGGLLVAASLLVGIALLVRREAQPLTGAVAAEIAGHHRDHRPIEFRAATFAALQGEMPKLGFALIEPRRIKEEGLQLLGGRYCSIRGRLAAQIALRDAKGQICTLYEAPLRPELRRVSDTEVDVGEVRVAVWRESGLLVGMAEMAGASTPR